MRTGIQLRGSKCLGVEVTVGEKFNGQLDTQHAKVFQFSLCSSKRN